MKFYARQSIDAGDVKAVTEALTSDFLTQGPAVEQFEQALADYTGAAHVLAVNSATSALILAYQAVLTLRDNATPVVWVPANTFVATANAAVLIGADVDFVDIDIATGNIDLNTLEARLMSATQLPDIVVPVHFAGLAVDMKKLRHLADRFGFAIVEDASHALGGHYDSAPLCRAQFSDAAVTSFHAVKSIATGEGGAVFTQDPHIADLCRSLRSHGVTRDKKTFFTASQAPWYYEQHGFGFNFRLSDVQAALGHSQLQRLDRFRAHKAALANSYRQGLSHEHFYTVGGTQDGSAFHLFPILLPEYVSEPMKIELYEALRAAGYQFNVHYYPVNEQPSYAAFKGQCPNAFRFYQREVSLPLHMQISVADVANICAVLNTWMLERAA